MSGVAAARRSSEIDRRRAAVLVRWFGRAGRDLPWRARRSGYRALVAEAMLQQTQVSRVLEKYPAFLRRFPRVRTLAAADEQSVLAAWQGLGYYRRARNLHGAAKMIVGSFKGRVPRTTEGLLQLPGVGRYTAGAIASIVYGEAAPIVDGNVQRVLARWEARSEPPQTPEGVRWAWERAEQLVEATERPGVVNEAMMELGALVCTPRAPSCGGCPVARWCEARRQGLQDRIPPAKPAVRRKRVHHHAVLLVRGDRLLLEQRGAREMWSGMWQPPTVEAGWRLSVAGVIDEMSGRGLRITGASRLVSFTHQTTHREVHFHVHRAATRARRGRWQEVEALDDVPMSNAHRRVVAVLRNP